jgi:hypothetical protein
MTAQRISSGQLPLPRPRAWGDGLEKFLSLQEWGCQKNIRLCRRSRTQSVRRSQAGCRGDGPRIEKPAEHDQHLAGHSMVESGANRFRSILAAEAANLTMRCNLEPNEKSPRLFSRAGCEDTLTMATGLVRRLWFKRAGNQTGRRLTIRSQPAMRS